MIMEHYEISKLLNDSTVKICDKKMLSIFCQQKYQFKTSMLRSDLFDYSNV